MKDLQLFQNDQFGQLRCHIDESETTWFCGKDTLSALDYAIYNDTSKHMGAVPDEWKGMKPIPTPGGTQEMLCITEQGLYFFLGRSDKPKALPYQKWVAGEIMPSIRRSGGYIAAPDNATPEEILARAVLVADDTIKRLKEKTASLESKVEADRPKVVFAESVEISKTTILVGEMAKLIAQAGGPDLGQNRLFKWLRDHGYLHKIGNQRNLPTQKSVDMGLIVIKEGTRIGSSGESHITRTSKITGKGQVYFVNKFLEKMKLVAA